MGERKINKQALGHVVPGDDGTPSGAAFEPVIVDKPGIEAIHEGLFLIGLGLQSRFDDDPDEK